MKHLKPFRVFVALLVALPGATLLELRAADPPKEPAVLAISVSPERVAPGGAARVTLRIEPKPGVKINRYPKIKLQVGAQDGLAQSAIAEMGNDRPPPPDKMSTNYYDEVMPLDLELHLDEGISRGRHDLDAKVTYFYCVTASGFCAPARVPVKIPLVVR